MAYEPPLSTEVDSSAILENYSSLAAKENDEGSILLRITFTPLAAHIAKAPSMIVQLGPDLQFAGRFLRVNDIKRPAFE